MLIKIMAEHAGAVELCRSFVMDRPARTIPRKPVWFRIERFPEPPVRVKPRNHAHVPFLHRLNEFAIDIAFAEIARSLVVRNLRWIECQNPARTHDQTVCL